MREEHCDLKVHVNGQHTFFLDKKSLCAFSGKLSRLVKQGGKRSQATSAGLKITDFPGGPEAFELTARFCYNNGRIPMNPSNISLLYCGATFLEMTEEFSTCNLLGQTEALLDGIYHWSWNDILTSLKSCETLLPMAESSGLLRKLISSLLAKISSSSDMPPTAMTPLASSSSSSSPDTSGFRTSYSAKTPDTIKHCFSREWWFDDLTVLHPVIIEHIMKALGAYGNENNNLILTRFLLQYLKAAGQKPGAAEMGTYSGLADTAVHGVVAMGRAAYSCRMLFWVLRVASGLGLNRECRHSLEKLIGLVLDQATLDDLLVSGNDGAVYDVNLVLRLLKVFVSAEDGGVSLQRMKRLGKLLDKYLREIAPDQSLKVAKFVGLAESLPDSARDCFDGVYRALDIYIESHPMLTTEERSRLCRCLNYEKLTLDTCKDLAKNPRIPPRVTIQALISQQSKLTLNTATSSPGLLESPKEAGYYYRGATYSEMESPSVSNVCEEKEELRHNIQRMKGRIVELEKVCREMKGHMSKMARNKDVNSSSPLPHGIRGLPRLC